MDTHRPKTNRPKQSFPFPFRFMRKDISQSMDSRLSKRKGKQLKERIGKSGISATRTGKENWQKRKPGEK